MKKRLFMLLGLSCMFLFGTAGCSYKELEDQIKTKIVKNEEGTEYTNTAQVPESMEEGIYQIGDCISVGKVTDREGQADGLDYTVESVQLADNISELQIDKDDMIDDRIMEDGTIESDNPDEKLWMIVATIRIKNTNINISGETGGELPFTIAMCAGTKDDITCKDGPFFDYARYFSGHPIGEDWKEKYYQFSLEKGEETEVRVGWIVSQEKLKKDYYYVLNESYETEYFQYVLLRTGGEE